MESDYEHVPTMSRDESHDRSGDDWRVARGHYSIGTIPIGAPEGVIPIGTPEGAIPTGTPELLELLLDGIIITGGV